MVELRHLPKGRVKEALTFSIKIMDPQIIEQQDELTETIVQIKRTSKKTKGGNRLSFSALAVVGDGAGRVGTSLSKAPSVIEAIKKATLRAKSQLVEVPIVGDARTIPHEIEVNIGASRVMLKPAPAGTGIRAGGPVRSVLQAAGVQNIVAKILGTSGKKQNVDTTIFALTQLKTIKQRIKKHS